MVTFRVDDVAPAAKSLPTLPLGDQFSGALVVGGDPSLPVLETDGVHPLLSAVGRAFADHRPLVLSPDAVWLTIMQGLAQHVRLHAEELRPRLVSHAGRKRLTVVVDGPMPQDADSWQSAVELFSKLLLAEINHADVFECDFSTSTDVERVAGRIVLLDAYSPYFALWMMFVCGIPSITLTGTVEDWQKIRTRVETIAAFGLETWCRSLAPIADQFVRAAAGDVDTAFWRRIYSPTDAYGGEVITGWAARLYPYLTGDGEVDRPNPLLELPIDEPRDVTVDDDMSYRGPGIRSDSVPVTLSRVTVNVNDRVGRDNRVVALHAGLVGVAQDEDGALRPVAGWYLAPATVEIDDVIDRIVRDHDTTPPQPHPLFFASADLMAIYRRIGSATLFDGAWRLRPIADHRRVPRGGDLCSIETIIDLADGRSVGAAIDFTTQTFHWVVCRIEKVVAERPDTPTSGFRLVDEPADVPVYGTSLALLLNAALDSGGDISHLETGRLDQLNGGVLEIWLKHDQGALLAVVSNGIRALMSPPHAANEDVQPSDLRRRLQVLAARPYVRGVKEPPAAGGAAGGLLLGVDRRR
ncbi:DUF4419 domain-containing protein [Actinomadura alba]|uniref:DUF4419 domain-containing protein n=1 Tax=Actinomadura alba TaxID=406431 RepID=A0ABR7LXJ4_9ACTN|nr:DUF4419 domain-containing protein [Actinomadura alba]MBC6469274.1 DUF4419 domain-containing protein [Actinomadura alba]